MTAQHRHADETIAHSEYARLLEESADDLFERAPVAYLATLVDGTIVRVNETLLEWTQYGRDELVGRRRLHDILAPGARIYYETHYAPLLQMQDSVRAIALELVRADGTRLPVLTSSTLVRDEAGNPQLIRTTAFDATERRRYEQELLRARADAETRARSALALAHVTEGVLVVGDDGNVLLLNPAAEAIFEVASEAATGRAAVEVLEGWDALAPRIPIARAGEHAAADMVPTTRGGREQWLEAAGVDGGDAVVYTIRDVTAERGLNQLRTDLVAIVSHELRTPLTGAYGAAQTLLSRYDDFGDGERRQLLELMVAQTTRLAKILDEILLASRLDTGNEGARGETFDAAAALETLVQGVEPSSQRRVIVDAPAGLTVRGDLDRLRQVLTNLVDNALKYSSGAVRVALAGRDLAARFTVADDGPGIPAGERERVFEKFYRLDPAQHAGVGGTGLGLYIARELVRRMDGRIGFLPRERGTTVFVDVPLASAPAEADDRLP